MARPLSREARDKAVEAAQVLLAEHGLDGCTLEAVSRRSGVARTTLYRHWGSANMLMVHAIDCQIERIPTPNTGSLTADLLELFTTVRHLIDDAANRRLLFEVLVRSTIDEELASVKAAMAHERTRPIRELVQRAVDRGEIPPIDLDLATDLVEGPIVARLMRTDGFVDHSDLPRLAALVARGLGAPFNDRDSGPATAGPAAPPPE